MRKPLVRRKPARGQYNRAWFVACDLLYPARVDRPRRGQRVILLGLRATR